MNDILFYLGLDSPEHLAYIAQLLSSVIIGGLVGELYRASKVDFSISLIHHLARFSAGAFLAYMVSYGYYYATQNKTWSLLLGGVLSFLDETFVIRNIGGYLKNNLKYIQEKLNEFDFNNKDKGED